MKHLKLYEGYLDDYYKEISHEYASRLIGPFVVTNGRLANKNMVEFNDREITRIKSMYTDIKKPNFRYGVEFNMDEPGKFLIKLYYIGLFGKKQMIEYQIIYKLDDDWFVLFEQKNLYNGWFKCDQFEGLIKCMEDHTMKFPPTDMF